MKIFSVILGITFLMSLPADASRHCKNQRNKTIAEQIARLDPSADLDLIDFDFFPGGSIVAGYEYEVEPAYTKGLYTRTDRWLISTKAIPSKDIDLGGDVDFSISGGLRNKTEATFIRFINDPCEAMLANPYSPRRIPLTAEVAIGPKFKKGDYFLFRGSVGFVASAELLSLIGSSMWGVGLSGSYLLEGFYQLHIVRLDDTHIRLKVVAHRGSSLGASVGIGYEEFEVFKVGIIDKQIERFINTKPVKLTASKGQSNIFMVDYILDLSDEEVATAFEQVLRKIKDFKKIEITAPFKRQRDLEANLLLDLSPLEDLFRTDYNQNQVGRLKRNLRTTSEQDSYAMGLNVGNKILGFKLNGGGSEAQMSIKNPDDFVERYLLKTWEKNWESRFLYSWSRNKEENRLSALFSADKEFRELVPVNVVRSMRQKKNRYTYKNFMELKRRLKKALPDNIYHDIPFDLWTQGPKDKFNNFGLRYELLMAPESIIGAPQLSVKDIKKLFSDYIFSKGLTPQDYFVESNSQEVHSTSAEDSFNYSLSQLAKHLAQALDKDLPMKARLDKITKLKFNVLFAESGLGFIMSLRPDMMKNMFHLDLDISANEADIDYSYGDSQLSELYKKILTIKAALDDDALDILREAESISVKQV